MHRVLRHGSLSLCALVFSLFGYHVVMGLGGPSASASEVLDRGGLRRLFGESEYRLSELRLLERTCYFVRERYVEPTRVRPELMFDAALDAVERQVDSVLLQKEQGGKLLNVSVGAFSTTLSLGPIDTLDQMRGELGRLARILDERLDENRYKKPEVEYAMINGVLSTLDPHSSLLPPEDSKNLAVENDGEFGGLGITITLVEGKLTVEYPLEDSPAFRAGVLAGDQIVRINEESTVNMSLEEAVSRLRGPVGEPVRVMIMRDLFTEPRPFQIVREVIKYNPPEGRLLEGGVGYIRIKNFNSNVTTELDNLLASFKRELGRTPAGLVLDLRDDPGGLLSQAVDVSSRFLETGATVVSTAGASDGQKIERSKWANGEIAYPMIVLTTAHSASASEIVAGALRNLDRAAVMGERTFGKGSVQHLFENSDASRLKLTVAHYLTPGEKSIQNVGIPPDVELVPYIIQMRNVSDGRKRGKVTKVDKGDARNLRKEPAATVLWRTRVTREADLDHPLVGSDPAFEAPSFRLPFLDRLPDDDTPRRVQQDFTKDWEVLLAREILLNTRGNRRADVVMGAAEVVARREVEERARIQEAFGKLGIDWTSGSQPAAADVELGLDLGPDGLLVAGEEEVLTLSITNRGETPLHQLLAVSKASAEYFDGVEFFFGRVEPGATKSWTRRIKLPAGYPTETDGIRFLIQDESGRVFAERTLAVRTRGEPLPDWAYAFRIRDDGASGSRGDGDGIPERGEIVVLDFTLTNRGEVPLRGAQARLKNLSGKDLDLRVGVVDFPVVGPGAQATDSLSFEVRGTGKDGLLEVELSVGSDEQYDYASVIRGSFYDYAFQKELLKIPTEERALGNEGRELLAALSLSREPSRLEITRVPPGEQEAGSVVISGVARDDHGVRDLIVYHGKEKIYYRGGEASVLTIPFTVERELQAGLNSFILLVQDDQGLKQSRQISVYAPGGVKAPAQP
jgi:carboxyl-terminal processing protease